MSDRFYRLGCDIGGTFTDFVLLNDQTGFYIERPEVRRELRRGCWDAFIELARAGLAIGIKVVNVQLMRPELNELDLMPRAIRMLRESTGCAIAVDTRSPEVLDLGNLVHERFLINREAISEQHLSHIELDATHLSE